jgi:hypothetical protein
MTCKLKPCASAEGAVISARFGLVVSAATPIEPVGLQVPQRINSARVALACSKKA